MSEGNDTQLGSNNVRVQALAIVGLFTRAGLTRHRTEI